MGSASLNLGMGMVYEIGFTAFDRPKSGFFSNEDHANHVFRNVFTVFIRAYVRQLQGAL